MALLKKGNNFLVYTMNADAEVLLACMQGDCDKLQQALAEGALPAEIRDPNGTTPLHVAAFGGHIDVARTLFAVGAGAAVADASGLTPLHVAVKGEHLEFSRWLVEVGAPLESVDSSGRTPLHTAASNGCLEMVRACL